MRVAAVAFVLIVGAAVVLAFANTLNSWVLGGLLGGLAAILLCIPISLAIFTLLARRQEARRRGPAETWELENVQDFTDEAYEDELMVYEAEGLLLSNEEDFYSDTRAHVLPNRRAPVSGYLPLPPVEQELDPCYEDEEGEPLVRRAPLNYPRQPRHPARSLTPDEGTTFPAPAGGPTRRPATRSLAQHQSAALRKARQEAQQQQQRLAQKHGGTAGQSRRSQSSHSGFSQRPRTSHSLRPRDHTSDLYSSEDEYDTQQARQYGARAAWPEAEDFSADFSTEELHERYQQYPRQSSYPRNPRQTRSRRPRTAEPWTGELDDEDEQEDPRGRRPRHDPERLSGNLRNPLVRRAPYLYEDDPLNEEFARQLDQDHPITRRSSLYESYREREDDR
ncbi:MAG TPA: hypothetical protein VF458_19030 [Ktedonobacteraceae bacterium]